MHSLKTVKHQTIKSYNDQMQHVAEGMAELAGGETLADRPKIAAELNVCVAHMLTIKKTFEKLVKEVQEPKPNPLVAKGEAFIITGVSRA